MRCQIVLIILWSGICFTRIGAQETFQRDDNPLEVEDITNEILNNILLQLYQVKETMQNEFRVQNLVIKAMEMKIDTMTKGFALLAQDVTEKMQTISEKIDMEDDILQSTLQQELNNHRSEIMNQTEIMFVNNEKIMNTHHNEVMSQISSSQCDIVNEVKQNVEEVKGLATIQQAVSKLHTQMLAEVLSNCTELSQQHQHMSLNFNSSLEILNDIININQETNNQNFVNILKNKITSDSLDNLKLLPSMSKDLSSLSEKLPSAHNNAELVNLLTTSNGMISSARLEQNKNLQILLQQCNHNREAFAKTSETTTKILELLNKPHEFTHHHRGPHGPHHFRRHNHP